MARPKKDNAEYHTHDKDMRNDKKIKALRKKFSHEGYSIYNMMLEVLDDCDHFRHQWDELNIELLSGDFDIDTDRLSDIINYAVKLGLFTIEGGYIFSFQHQKRFKPLLSKRKRNNSDVSGEFPGVSAVENPHSIVKYSKEEESKEVTIIPKESTTPKVVELGTVAPATAPPPPQKEKKNKKLVRELPDTVQQVISYMSEKYGKKIAPGRISMAANKFFSHYSANGWMQNKGKPIVSWQHAANMWIYNEIEGTFGNPAPVMQQFVTASKTPAPPPEPDLSPSEKDQLAKQYLQDCYEDFCNGDRMVLEMMGGLYNRLARDGLLVLSPEEKARIKSESNGIERESKKIAVIEYFKKMKEQGQKRIYELVG